MPATVYVYRFEDGKTIDLPPCQPETQARHIENAAKAARAKLIVNRIDGGVRTMKVRMPSSHVEFLFKLHCAVLPPEEYLTV